jgi:hypothetical protein
MNRTNPGARFDRAKATQTSDSGEEERDEGQVAELEIFGGVLRIEATRPRPDN